MKLPPLFNPSNDMALAANLRQYTPPRHIRQMEHDLHDLALLWDEGPWGWSLATRQHYLRLGIAEAELPSDEWLRTHRRLSSREFGVAYYQALTAAFGEEPSLLPCRARFWSEQEQEQGDEWPSCSPSSPLILKSPWSSSGRGNIVLDTSPPDAATAGRIRHILHQQGGIVVEPFYCDKALDFALEFHCGDRGVSFLGCSVFQADAAGRYGGNYVESQSSLLQRIGLPDTLFHSLVRYHLRALAALPYRGPVGIDMMRLADGRVHPCVEINFRMTMGLLALMLYNKGITRDQLLAGREAHGFTARIAGGRLLCGLRVP